MWPVFTVPQEPDGHKPLHIMADSGVTAASASDATTDVADGDNNDNDSDDSIPVTRIILCSFLFAIVIMTIAGNVVVLLAFCIEKRLRNTFTYFIFNLAVTDVLVAVTAMFFYTFDVLLGYWPFGEVLCGIWVFFDYGMTFASVFTLVAISLDRLWSIVWGLHYRTHNTLKKTVWAIAIVW